MKFRERFPEEQFRIVESDSSTVIEQVASHLVDIGFSGTVIEKANCKYIPFYQDDLVVIMPNTKEYQKIVKEQKDLKWLEGEPLIMREEGSGTRKEAEKQLKKMGISLDDLNIVATIENPEAVKRSVKSGLGITIISRLATADEIQSGEVLEFPFSQAGSGRNLNLVYNKNYKLPAAAEHVLKYPSPSCCKRSIGPCVSAMIARAIGCISSGKLAEIVGSHRLNSSSVSAVASAKFFPSSSEDRARFERREPPQSGHASCFKNLATRARPLSSFTLESAFFTVFTAL